MATKTVILKDQDVTISEIIRLAKKYYNDLDLILLDGMPVYKLNLIDFFDLVKRIPYSEDPDSHEIVMRPYYIFKSKYADCKKKSILIASFCNKNKIPNRFVICSVRPDRQFHHIYNQIKNGSKWLNVDSTYSDNIIFSAKKNLTNKKVY